MGRSKRQLPRQLERTALVSRVECRLMLRGALSLGALTLLTGCDISDNDAVQSVLAAFSHWNHRVQAALFGANRLAQTFPESEAVKDFRYNVWYPPEKAPKLDASSHRLRLAGRIADKRPWTVKQLHAAATGEPGDAACLRRGLEHDRQVDRYPLREFLRRIGADTTAKYVGFECADGYYEGMDMQTALHPQTLMAFKLSDGLCRRNTATLSRSASRRSWGSRTRNG